MEKIDKKGILTHLGTSEDKIMVLFSDSVTLRRFTNSMVTDVREIPKVSKEKERFSVKNNAITVGNSKVLLGLVQHADFLNNAEAKLLEYGEENGAK